MEQLLPSPRPSLLSKWSAASLIVVSFLGFSDATYLTVEHYLGVIPPCTEAFSCETVLRSAYATILGMPVALVGALFYLVVLVLTLLYLDIKKRSLLKVIFGLTAAAFIASLGFVFLQIFIIKALCLYCMGSALTSTLLFITSSIVWKKLRRLEASEVSISTL